MVAPAKSPNERKEKEQIPAQFLSRLEADLREIAGSYSEPIATSELKRKQLAELKEIAHVMNGANSLRIEGGVEANHHPLQWFLGGGTGLEIATGGLRRVHKDLDVVVFKADAQRWVDYFKGRGLKVMSEGEGHFLSEIPDDAVLTQVLAKGKLLIVDESKPQEDTSREVELLFIDRDENGVKHGNLPLRFDYSQFVVKDVDGEEVAITPPEVLLFHKLTDCRHKDLEDVVLAFTSFDESRLKRFLSYADKAFAGFKLRGVDGPDRPISLEELVSLHADEKYLAATYLNSPEYTELVQETTEKLVETAKELYGIYFANSREDFIGSMENRFGKIEGERLEGVKKFMGFLYPDVVSGGHEVKVRAFDEVLDYYYEQSGVKERLSQRVGNVMRHFKLAEPVYK